MSGWIKIHRDISKHWISQDMEKLGRWLDLLIFASYEDNKVLVGDRLIELKRGQMIASCDFLAKRWGCSKSTVSKFLELLESDNMVERCTERKITKLTICNYDSYQQKDDTPSNDIANDCRTIAERLPNELKKLEEIQEINITNNSACAREENVEWDDVKENSYFERFRAQGSAREIMSMTGKSLDEVMKLLDVYRAKRKLQNRGHKDFYQFCSLFAWNVQNNKLSLPQQTAKQKKVTTSADLFKEMYGQ